MEVHVVEWAIAAFALALLIVGLGPGSLRWRRLVTWARADKERRRGPWIQTRSGARWYPYSCRAEDVRIEDLGVCAYIIRWGGHAGMVTVAEHQYRVGRYLAATGHDAWTQLLGLLHDTHEVYPPGDVLAPVFWGPRWLARPLRRLSRRAEHAVRDRLGLPRVFPEAVKEADMRLLSTEAYNRLPGGPRGWASALPGPLPVSQVMEPAFAEWRWWAAVAKAAGKVAAQLRAERRRPVLDEHGSIDAAARIAAVVSAEEQQARIDELVVVAEQQARLAYERYAAPADVERPTTAA